MLNLRDLSDPEIFTRTQKLVAEERKITAEILWLLREVDRRRLFVQYGAGSLFDFAVKILGYSDSAAMRRINSSRLLKEIPEIATSIEEGRLSLSNAAAVQSFFKKEQVMMGKTYSPIEKREILKSVENQSRRECEKTLAKISPASVIPQESQKVLTETKTELRMVLEQTVLDQLNRIKALLAHTHPNASYADLIQYMTDLTLEKIDPIQKAKRAQVREEKNQSALKKGPEKGVNSKEAVNSSPAKWGSTKRTYIPAHVQHKVWLRDQGMCTFKDPKTGKPCGSEFAVQIDHIIPITRNRSSDLNSLRLLCSVHNKWEAIRIMGETARHLST